MRHKYETRGIILARAPVGESSAFLTILTPDIGLVRALAQSVRRSGAKLAPALATFVESDLVLVRGREWWRVSGAVQNQNWCGGMPTDARRRAARVTGLFLRLVAGEAHDPSLFVIMTGFFKALAELPRDAHRAVELLAVLRVLAALGLDAGEIPQAEDPFGPTVLAEIVQHREKYLKRINQGIEASGL
jgi:DNA repair protein RecO (recombination protein O)